jgi:hypothetical protein
MFKSDQKHETKKNKSYLEINPSIFPSLVSTVGRHKDEVIKDPKVTRIWKKIIFKFSLKSINLVSHTNAKSKQMCLRFDFKDH